MTAAPTQPSAATTAAYLRSLDAVRTRCTRLLNAPAHLQHFDVHLDRLPAVAARVHALALRDYASLADIPGHSRWRHVDAGGVPRTAQLDAQWTQKGVAPLERTVRMLDLVVVSVLLDAGAGDKWSYTVSSSSPSTALSATSANAPKTYARSEGLAIAALDWFLQGGFSSDPDTHPHRVDAKGLQSITPKDLAAAFQVSDTNPLVGVEGRAGLLNRLGNALDLAPQYFGGEGPAARPGNMIYFLRKGGGGGGDDTKTIHFDRLWEVIVLGLAPVWPATRTTLAGTSLGDVWKCDALSFANADVRSANTSIAIGPSNAAAKELQWGDKIADPAGLVKEADTLMPFHKLSQWLAYSLLEPIAAMGVKLLGIEKLTGLAEYRNGGVFVDMGVLVLKPATLAEGKQSSQVPRFPVHHPAVVEWRALTVALLDLVAKHVRGLLKLDEKELPLAKVLEAGTWKLGRELAAEHRPGTKGPPIEIISDGTVF